MKKKIPELYEKYCFTRYRYRRQKSLFDSKSPNLKITNPEKVLFEKLELRPEEEISDNEHRPRRFRPERHSSPTGESYEVRVNKALQNP